MIVVFSASLEGCQFYLFWIKRGWRVKELISHYVKVIPFELFLEADKVTKHVAWRFSWRMSTWAKSTSQDWPFLTPPPPGFRNLKWSKNTFRVISLRIRSIWGIYSLLLHPLLFFFLNTIHEMYLIFGTIQAGDISNLSKISPVQVVRDSSDKMK